MKGWLITLYFLLFPLFFAYNASAPTQPSCPHDQSVALIQFSNSFSIYCSYSKTMSWKKAKNCCGWEGVKCDTETGNVIGLDLSSSCLVGPFPFNSTLFLLRYLRQLNLGGNDFSMSPIPSQFGQLTSLTHLSISETGFTGKIPLEISHLSKLTSLDLSSDYYGNLMFEGHVFENVVGNLTQLRHLILSDVNISSVEPTSFLNMSHYITTLILEGNGLQGMFPEDVFHFPYLEKFSFTMDQEGQEVELKFPKTNWSGPLKSLQVSYPAKYPYLLQIPESIGNLKYLEILVIYGSNLRGSIPVTVENLTLLKYIDLSSNSLTGPILFSFSAFKHLRYLDLSDNNFVGHISDSFGNLTKLIHLYLNVNKLSGPFPVSAFNLPKVEVVDFSINNFVGSLPSKVCGLSRLSKLYLSYNFLFGSIPSLLFSLPSLVELGLRDNKLTGPIEHFDEVAPLEFLDLHNNEMQGPIPGSVSKLVNLTILDLSSNNLSGNFELDKLSKLKKLEVLSLSDNALLSLTSASNATYSLPNLWSLNLSSCNTSEFPNFVRNLEVLNYLDLSYNRVRVIEADMFLKLKRLQSLDLSHNSLLLVSNNRKVSLVLPNLNFLSFSSCNITEFSNFLTTQKGLTDLDLSNNSIRGQITKQERNWGSNLKYLDLSNNLLTVVEYFPWKHIEVLNLASNLLEGPLLVPPPSTYVYSISKNRLTGEIPSSICNLGRSVPVGILDLSHNNLSGAVPKCLGLTDFSILDLHNNNFHGNVPQFCVEGNKLQTLNLNNNDFDGPLPKSLANCYHLEVLNLGNNKINDTFPHWLGTLPQLQVLVLRANRFHGQIIHLENGLHFSTLRILDLSHNEFSGFLPTTYFASFRGMMNVANVQIRYIGDDRSYYHDSVVLTMKGVDTELGRILTIFSTIDMSSNKFEGAIPEITGNLISLQVLNFSHNHLTGHIPSSLGNVTALESLDLSCNKLVGGIPSLLTDLLFLEVLNLSKNQLVGLIPQGKQFNTFLNDSYSGNSGLCGFPVSKSCGHSEPSAPVFDEEVDSAFGLDWKFVLMGYGCGMVFGFSAGYILMATRKPKWLAGMVQRAGNKVVSRFKKY